jgi:hypothetical protein
MSYYEIKKQKILQKQKQYRKDNLEYIKDYQRMWYQQKRYHIRCSICGVKYLKHNEKNHFKTKRHQRGYTKIQQKVKVKLKVKEEKIIPYKTIFVSKNKIIWRLP